MIKYLTPCPTEKCWDQPRNLVVVSSWSLSTDKKYQVMCKNCGFIGPEAETEYGACILWNCAEDE